MEDAKNTLIDGTYFGKSGIMMPLNNGANSESYVRSRGDEWNWAHDRFELVGYNVKEGAAPLIYLAGAVAIAHADELLDAATLVQQR